MSQTIDHHQTTPVSSDDLLVYRRHPANLWGPAALTILVVLMTITFAIILSTASFIPVPFIVLYAGVFIFLAFSYFFMYWLFWYLDIWVVTKDKLIDSQLITFFLYRRSELDLRQVQDVKHSIVGTLASLLNYGDILIQSAATSGSFLLMSIKNPGEAVDKIKHLVDAASKTQVVATLPSVSTVLLGEKLIQGGFISPTDLAAALTEQQNSPGKRLGNILVEKGLLKRSDLVTALSSQHRMPEIDISRYDIDPSALKHISVDMAQKYTVIPVSHTNNGILAAIAEPSEATMSEIRGLVGVPIDFVVADEDYIKEAIRGHYLSGESGAAYGG